MMNNKNIFLIVIVTIFTLMTLFFLHWNNNLFKNQDVQTYHNKWWLKTVEDGVLVTGFKPDITEEYYEIIFLKKWKYWYYMIWDWMLTEEDYQEYLENIKSKIKESIIIKSWNNMYILHENNAIELSRFEEDNFVKFNLDNYNLVNLK